MRPIPRGFSKARIGFVVGTLALTGCVPGAYVYEDAPVAYYGGGSAYYTSPAPAYYGYPGYHGYPGYYRYAPYPPRVVYVDHDHRGDDCRHESHRNHGPRDHRPPPPGQGPRDHRPPPPGQGPRDHRPPSDEGPHDHRPPPPGASPSKSPPRVGPKRDRKAGDEERRELD